MDNTCRRRRVAVCLCTGVISMFRQFVLLHSSTQTTPWMYLAWHSVAQNSAVDTRCHRCVRPCRTPDGTPVHMCTRSSLVIGLQKCLVYKTPLSISTKFTSVRTLPGSPVCMHVKSRKYSFMVVIVDEYACVSVHANVITVKKTCTD